MSCVAKLDLTIIQGATFTKAINWYGGGKVCKQIEDLVPGCPTTITITAHGLPTISETPVFIKHVKGATRANTKPDSPAVATYIDVDSFYVDVDTVGQTYTASTGLVTYFAPKNLLNYTARMQIREELDDTTVILELTSPDDITISLEDAKITMTIDSDVTAGLEFETAVYDLELLDDSVPPVVTRLVAGEIELCKEVTR